MDEKAAVELLRRMKRIRMAEEAIAERYSEWKMRCPTHLCIGQEVAGAAVGLALRGDDMVVSTHRSHGHYLGKGGSLERMIAELYGKASGCSGGKGGSMHMIDLAAGFVGSTAIVGGTIPIGVGLGLSFAIKGTDQVSCIFFGDGAVEEGVFYESANFAALRKLPVLFVCENNLYSVYSNIRSRQPAGRAIHRMVGAMGMETRHGDGNDAVAVHEELQEVVAGIRAGNGPCFLELDTYRWREHCGPNYDNDLGYRSEAEFLAWKAKDPIPQLCERLLAKGVLTAAAVAAMEAAIAEEVEQAFAFAEAAPFPPPEAASAHLYKESPCREC